MIEQKDIDLIDRYLHNQLIGNDLTVFLIRAEKDQEFASEIEFMRNVNVAAKIEGRNELKKKLEIIASEHKKENLKKTFRINPIISYSIAALIILFIGIIIIFKSQNKSGEHELISQEKKEINNIINREAHIANIQSIKVHKDSLSFGYAALPDTVIISIFNTTNEKYKDRYLWRGDTLYLFGNVGKINRINLDEKLMTLSLVTDDSSIIKLPALVMDSIMVWE